MQMHRLVCGNTSWTVLKASWNDLLHFVRASCRNWRDLRSRLDCRQSPVVGDTRLIFGLAPRRPILSSLHGLYIVVNQLLHVGYRQWGEGGRRYFIGGFIGGEKKKENDQQSESQNLPPVETLINISSSMLCTFRLNAKLSIPRGFIRFYKKRWLY